ncbi:HPr kinase/phosphorylase [Aestuariivirga sp.]|uniref:HPr kinase/phosphorylase n=1 Tax=Aestuariivirga sp. TaxID=2650926 RepID=UPI0039E24CCC
MPERITLHGTCVSIEGQGVLLLGPPGSGKSDLALRLIDQPGLGTGLDDMRAMLVSDDQVTITVEEESLRAQAPQAIAGLLEIRGLGVVRVPCKLDAVLRMVVRLKPAAEIERLPVPQQTEILGQHLPVHEIDPWALSAPARVRAALRVNSGL